MIRINRVKKYCRDDISKIENYEQAVNSPERWHCHHRDEIRTLPSGMTVYRSREELIENGRYYHCPAYELIFLTHSEHTSLHRKGKTQSEETKKRRSESMKGKKHSEETKKRMRENHGGGVTQHSEEAKKKMREKALIREANKKALKNASLNTL